MFIFLVFLVSGVVVVISREVGSVFGSVCTPLIRSSIGRDLGVGLGLYGFVAVVMELASLARS